LGIKFSIIIYLVMNEHHDLIIHLSAELPCSQERAFDFFTDSALLQEWLCEKAVVELTTAGKYELFWNPDDPDPSNDSTWGCKILAFERGKFLHVEWRGNAEQKHYMNTVRPLTQVTVMFFMLDAAKTKVVLVHTGWRQGQDWESARQYFIQAWTGAFQQLEQLAGQNA
jgi:uncharacterized protein YndB with AHSA1/START domain